MLRKFSSLALVIILAVLSNSTLAGEALWTHQFASESGFPLTLSQNAPPEGQTLALFWASWCLPCKGELSDLVAREADFSKNLRIVAINVDDPSGLPLAQSFLASIKWPYQVMRDNSGQFFYEYNRSLQLPFSVLLDAKGQELKTFQKLSDADFDELAKIPATPPGDEKSGPLAVGESTPGSKIKTQFGGHSEAVDFNGNNDHARMATFTGFGRVDTTNWSAQLQYDFLYEKFESNDHHTLGDELGFSYVEYHSDIGQGVGQGRAQLRIGDAHEALLAGELLSLQNFPNLADPASVRGGTAQWDQGDWSFTGFGGLIHPALFSSPINPTTELALPDPGEKVGGASVFWHHDVSGSKSQVNLNFVNYHRDVNTQLGYSNQVDDNRYGAEVYQSFGDSGLQLRGATFSSNAGSADADPAERPYIVDPYIWWTIPGLKHQVYSLHYIEFQSLPARTLTPVLVENPALPLQASKIRSVRFSPKFYNEAESVWFEPIYIFEDTVALVPYQRQNSYGFNLGLPKEDRKLIAFYQDGLTSPTTPYREASALATTPIVGPLTTQLLLRHHDADSANGDSDGLTLGLDLGRLWKLPMPGRLLLSGQWTRQSGFYFGFSGLAQSDLFSGHLEWTQGVNTIRLGIGSEPGGIVCTNGVCVQKPPLNGANLEVAFTF